MKTRKIRTAKRLNKSGLARFLRVSRTTITKYAAEPTAPQPDRQGRYDREEFRAFITREAPTVADRTDPEVQALRHEKLALEVGRLRREDAVRRGELIPISDLSDAVAAVMHEIDGTARRIFEEELPKKCAGKSAAEIRALNHEAMNRWAAAFKAAATKLETDHKPNKKPDEKPEAPHP